jgi:hypothetical protein
VIEIGVRLVIQSITLRTLETILSFALHNNLENCEKMPPPLSVENVDMDSRRFEDSIDAPYIKDILDAAVAFIIFNFPPTFTLDTRVRHLKVLGGLPPPPEERYGRTVSNPLLDSICFGEFPPKPNEDSSLLSTVLLSVPFFILENISEHLAMLGLLHEIIRERERRRLGFLNAKTSSDDENGNMEGLSRRAAWKESSAGNGSGHKIRRVWVGCPGKSVPS